MKWHKIPVDLDLSKPFIKKVKIDGKAICLVNHESELYALSTWCPHAGADLSYGFINQNGKLVCPIHRLCYSLQTGKGCEGQNDFVESYAVEVKDDGIYIGITGFWEKIKDGLK